jgi:sugar phosphate isomerase/epimerase
MGKVDRRVRELSEEFRLSRRGFLAGAAGAGAAYMLGGPLASAVWAEPGLPPSRLGIQLFTVRDKVTSDGFAVVFQTLAGFGYKEIEFAGYTSPASPGITPAQIRGLLDANGLRAIGSHRGLNNFRTALQAEIDIALALGMPYLGTANAPSNTPTVAAYKAAAEEFNSWGATMAAQGVKFYQHNHAGEFAFATDKPTVRLYDTLMKHTDPELVYFEMDIYWAHVAQHLHSVRPDGTAAPFDPLDYIRGNRKRYPLYHVKDGVPNPANPNGYDFADVGDGVLPFAELVGIGKPDYHHYIVERDNAPTPAINPPPEGSYRSARRSAEYILDNLLTVRNRDTG